MKPSEEARLNEVKRIGKDRASEAANTLTSAFADDVFSIWLREDPKQSDFIWWECLLRNTPVFSEVHAMGDLSAVAIWLPSQELAKQFFEETGTKSSEKNSDLVRAREAIATTAYECFGERYNIFGKIHELAPKEPHWYLGVIGTLQEYFGKGRGTLLLKEMTKHLDEVGLPAYLEASNLKNSALYARHGFEITQEINLMGAPTLYSMRRKPK